MVVTERGLRPVASAIWVVVGDLLKIISPMNSRVEGGIWGQSASWDLWAFKAEEGATLGLGRTTG